MLKASNKKRASSNYLFTGGSSLDFLISKAQLNSRFRAKNCFDYISTPSNMVPNPSPNQILLTENVFEELEPTRTTEVDERIDTYDNDILVVHNSAKQTILAADLDPAESAKLLVANDLKLNERQFKRTNYIQELEKNFLNSRSDYYYRRDKHLEKQANVYDIITTSYSSNVLAPVKHYLESNQPRRTIYELSQIYSAEAAGSEGHILLYEHLTSLKFKGTNVSAHLERFDHLVEAAIDAGYSINDEQLLMHLVKSFSNSENTEYKRYHRKC